MIRINQLKLPINHTAEEMEKKLCKILHIKKNDIEKISISKKSLDARKKPDLMFVYTVDVLLKNESRLNKRLFGTNILKYQPERYEFNDFGNEPMRHSPIVIGMGPAGLFAAYMLAKNGYRPIVLERGKAVEERKKDVDRYWETGVLDITSNVQFGEGGAGTFSDGKLNTVVKDKGGKNHYVLETFCKFGADEEILYSNKPHIGTDVLIDVVKNMRNEIIRLGGDVRFESEVTGIEIKNNRIRSVLVNDEYSIESDAVVMAIGHSARNTFEWLYKSGVKMEAKNFAVGVRIQHPQEMIDKQMYGFSHKESDVLTASPYKLTGHADNGRSVFSFCMCPGGYVVDASSEKGRIAVNGMSYSRRDGENANSAIIVSVTGKDYIGEDALSGMRFQRELEERAYKEGNGAIPVQLFGDYKDNKKSESFGEVLPCIKGKYNFGNINNIFPAEINEALIQCITEFEKSISGYGRYDAILAGVESRTSSPVRINRNEAFESNIAGLYPCGEGAGYAGGITSAAMDGIRIFEAIAGKYAPCSKV